MFYTWPRVHLKNAYVGRKNYREEPLMQFPAKATLPAHMAACVDGNFPNPGLLNHCSKDSSHCIPTYLLTRVFVPGTLIILGYSVLEWWPGSCIRLLALFQTLFFLIVNKRRISCAKRHRLLKILSHLSIHIFIGEWIAKTTIRRLETVVACTQFEFEQFSPPVRNLGWSCEPISEWIGWTLYELKRD